MLKEIGAAALVSIMFSVLVVVLVDALEFEKTGACHSCVLLPLIRPSLAITSKPGELPMPFETDEMFYVEELDIPDFDRDDQLASIDLDSVIEQLL